MVTCRYAEGRFTTIKAVFAGALILAGMCSTTAMADGRLRQDLAVFPDDPPDPKLGRKWCYACQCYGYITPNRYCIWCGLTILEVSVVSPCPYGSSESRPACEPGPFGPCGGGGNGGALIGDETPSQSLNHREVGPLNLQAGVGQVEPQDDPNPAADDSEQPQARLSGEQPDSTVALTDWPAALAFLVSLPSDIFVCPDGSGDFASLDEAVRYANNGDIIECCSIGFDDTANQEEERQYRVIIWQTSMGKTAISVFNDEQLGWQVGYPALPSETDVPVGN